MTAPLFESLNEMRIFEQSLNSRSLGKRIHFHDRTQSTNDLAVAAARSNGEHGSVFVADIQTAGRGRRGRNWECPPAVGLLFSVMIRPATIPLEAGGWIPLVAGLACAEALASISERLQSVTVKWPNDIVFPCDAAPGWKKLGGILCESALPALSSTAIPTGGDSGYAVIGIGLNLNQTRDMLPETGKAPPTSVLLETEKHVDRKAVLKIILERLEAHLDTLGDASQRDSLKTAIEDKMRAWLPPSKSIAFRTPPLDAPLAADKLGTFAGLDTYGRIRIENNGIETPYADMEIVAVQP